MKSFLSPRSLCWLSLIVFDVMFAVISLGMLIDSGFDSLFIVFVSLATVAYAIPISLAIMVGALVSFIVRKIAKRKNETQEYMEKETKKTFEPSGFLQVLVFIVASIGALASLPAIVFFATSMVVGF